MNFEKVTETLYVDETSKMAIVQPADSTEWLVLDWECNVILQASSVSECKRALMQ